jgi:hypothetical protein
MKHSEHYIPAGKNHDSERFRMKSGKADRTTEQLKKVRKDLAVRTSMSITPNSTLPREGDKASIST